MTNRIDVKTKADAEKALKAGLAINILAGSFALSLVDVNVSIWISGDAAPSIVTRGTSAPRIETWGTSAPRIETWGTSAPSIVTWGTSAPSIVTWGTSAPRIETWGTSAPRIDANGFSYAYVRGDRLTGKATANVVLRFQGNSAVDGGQQFRIVLETAQDWCDFYGVRTDNGQAVVYKAVGDDYKSHWGTRYAPGTMPKDNRWDGAKNECSAGGGLNFSPTPRHTHEFVAAPKHYLECRIALDEMVVHFDGRYPQKVCAPAVVAPLIEVDVDGEPVAIKAEA